MNSEVDRVVDHLFRREAGKMVATLARTLGFDQLALAEDSIQEALLRAVRQWPFGGIPHHPAAWLMRVARNHAIDHVRREQNFRRKRKSSRFSWKSAAGTGPNMRRSLTRSATINSA